MFIAEVVRHQAGEPAMHCLTDNPAVGQWLWETFVSKFVGFRDVEGEPRIVQATMESRLSENKCCESGAGDGIAATMTWDGLGEAFAVDAEHPRLPYDFVSLFIPAETGSIAVDARALPGATGTEGFGGRDVSSACLALSEIWVERDSPGA
jgi:hypothetical protein